LLDGETEKPQHTATDLLITSEIHSKRPFMPTPRAEPPREVIQSIFAAVPKLAKSAYFAPV
jgi:hypothetical protein